MAVTQKQIDALRASDAALDKRLDAEVTNRANADTSLANRITTLEGQVKLLVAAGGSGGGTTPVPNTPPPADPPTTEPSGSGVTLPVGTSQSDFLTAVANLSYDYLLLAGGDRSWNMCDISVDRTANPLLIQPVAGQRVRFTGAGSATYGIFRFGVATADGNLAKWITFDGRTPDGFLFDGITLDQAGIFGLFGSDHLTIRNYTARNLKRGPNATTAAHSWVGYISAPWFRTNTNLLLDRGTLMTPNVNRGVSAYQIDSHPEKGTHGTIDITNQSINGYAFAGYFASPVSDLGLDNWDVFDCGRNGRSIDFVNSSIHGAASDMSLTASDPIQNNSGGNVVVS